MGYEQQRLLAWLSHGCNHHLWYTGCNRPVVTRLTIEDVISVLETFSVEEILEYNGMSIEDAIYFMVEEKFIELPKLD